MDPKLFVATKAFIVYEGKILILRESSKYQDGSNIGHFDLPGGRVKSGERFDEGLRREVYEETGLQIRIEKPFYVGEWRPVVKEEPWQIVGIFFTCTADSDRVILSTDHDTFEWIDPKNYEKHHLIPTNLPAFRAFLEK